jgi:hypothetical protein
MITSIKVWSKNGDAVATFQSTRQEKAINNISLNDVKAFIADANRIGGSAKFFGETLVVTVIDTEKDKMLKKLKEIFPDFKQTKA